MKTPVFGPDLRPLASPFAFLAGDHRIDTWPVTNIID
jgi:hypothetical protein